MVQTMQKGINNRSKIDAKSKPEKRLPKGAKITPKGSKIDVKIHPKFKKEPKGSRGGANNPKKVGKKECQKRRWKKEEKWSQNVLAPHGMRVANHRTQFGFKAYSAYKARV